MANRQFRRYHLATRGLIIEMLEDQNVTTVLAQFRILTALFHDSEEDFKRYEQLSKLSAVSAHKQQHRRMTATGEKRQEITRRNHKALGRLPNVYYHLLPCPGGYIKVVYTYGDL